MLSDKIPKTFKASILSRGPYRPIDPASFDIELKRPEGYIWSFTIYSLSF